MAALADGLAKDRLGLILLPTEACNFRCVYCYEDFQLGRMKPAVVDGVVRLIENRWDGLGLLTVSWFGGEPLAAPDIVIRVMSRIRELQRLDPRARVASDMTTNGWLLTGERFDELHALGVTRYQVSFDGPPDVHDAKRHTAGGRGSFDRIWSNLRELSGRPEPFTVAVRLHVDRDNLDRLPGFLKLLREDFQGDSRFPLFLKLLGKWGGPHDDKLRVFDRVGGEAALARLRSIAENLGLPLASATSEHSVCYAAQGNSFVIRADGRINKCTLALDSPANQVGRIESDGSIRIDHHRILPWMRGLFSGDARELQCPMIGLADERFRTESPDDLDPSRFVGSV